MIKFSLFIRICQTKNRFFIAATELQTEFYELLQKFRPIEGEHSR